MEDHAEVAPSTVKKLLSKHCKVRLYRNLRTPEHPLAEIAGRKEPWGPIRERARGAGGACFFTQPLSVLALSLRECTPLTKQHSEQGEGDTALTKESAELTAELIRIFVVEVNPPALPCDVFPSFGIPDV